MQNFLEDSEHFILGQNWRIKVSTASYSLINLDSIEKQPLKYHQLNEQVNSYLNLAVLKIQTSSFLTTASTTPQFKNTVLTQCNLQYLK